ncbi:MAG: hypothetical protein WC433_05040 [Candidatus Omnitrophota bacterium]|jgi:hypothetical protein
MNKLAIVGSGPLTRNLAPYKDNNFDIWVFNEAPLNDWCERWDASFQLHKKEVYSGINFKNENYWQWLQEKHEKPVYMQDIDPLVPDSEKYPLDDVLSLTGFRYVGMSMSYALALAILKGYEHIEIWGIELSYTEYQFGADSWRFWVGFAQGRLGKDHVILHCGLNLFDNLLYGYEGGFNFEPEYFKERQVYLTNGWNAAEKHLKGLRGLFEKHIKNNEKEKVADLIKELEKSAQDAGEYSGRLCEAEKYLTSNHIDRGLFEIAGRQAQLDGEEKKALMYQTKGQCEYVWNVWKQSDSLQAAENLISLLMKFAGAAYDTGALYGIYKENVDCVNKYDAMVTANGGMIGSKP